MESTRTSNWARKMLATADPGKKHASSPAWPVKACARVQGMGLSEDSRGHGHLEGRRCLARFQTQVLRRAHWTMTPFNAGSNASVQAMYRQLRWAHAYGEAVGQGDHDRMQASSGCCGIDAHPDGCAGAVGRQPAPAARISPFPTCGACTGGNVAERVGVEAPNLQGAIA